VSVCLQNCVKVVGESPRARTPGCCRRGAVPQRPQAHRDPADPTVPSSEGTAACSAAPSAPQHSRWGWSSPHPARPCATGVSSGAGEQKRRLEPLALPRGAGVAPATPGRRCAAADRGRTLRRGRASLPGDCGGGHCAGGARVGAGARPALMTCAALTTRANQRIENHVSDPETPRPWDYISNQALILLGGESCSEGSVAAALSPRTRGAGGRVTGGCWAVTGAAVEGGRGQPGVRPWLCGCQSGAGVQPLHLELRQLSPEHPLLPFEFRSDL